MPYWFSRKAAIQPPRSPEVAPEFTSMHYSWPGCCRRPARVPWPIYRATCESISREQCSAKARLQAASQPHESIHNHSDNNSSWALLTCG